MGYVVKFLLSLTITVIVETPVVFVFINYVFRLKTKWHTTIVFSIIASTLTLPYLWFVFPKFLSAKNYILIGEFSVTFAEGLLYAYLFKVRVEKAMIISIAANATSYFLGKQILSSFF